MRIRCSQAFRLLTIRDVEDNFKLSKPHTRLFKSRNLVSILSFGTTWLQHLAMFSSNEVFLVLKRKKERKTYCQ